MPLWRVNPFSHESPPAKELCPCCERFLRSKARIRAAAHAGSTPRSTALPNVMQEGAPMVTKKLCIAGFMMLAALGALAAQDAGLETQLVNVMNKLWGVHPGFRANHAKGVVTTGTFKATPQAAQLSKAVLFAGGTIPVTIRFSDATGVPNIPDGSDLANGHGMAIKFHLPDGTETDMVLNSIKFFPLSSSEDFRDMLLAIAASPPNAAKPTNLEQFIAAHPTVSRALATAQTPDSFADEEYHGINAFVFVNDKGERRAVRYIVSPEKLVHLDPAQAAQKGPDFLVDELLARLARAPVTFRLKAQLASPGDTTKDPSQPWPDSDEVVELGVLTIDKPVSDSLNAQKKLLFLPGQLTEGIEISDDPMIETRNGAYAVSFSRRTP
jgi:catalase